MQFNQLLKDRHPQNKKERKRKDTKSRRQIPKSFAPSQISSLLPACVIERAAAAAAASPRRSLAPAGPEDLYLLAWAVGFQVFKRRENFLFRLLFLFSLFFLVHEERSKTRSRSASSSSPPPPLATTKPRLWAHASPRHHRHAESSTASRLSSESSAPRSHRSLLAVTPSAQSRPLPVSSISFCSLVNKR